MVEALPALPGVIVLVSKRVPYVDELEARATALGVADRLHVVPYVPHREDVTTYIATADAGVHPLVHVLDGQPLVNLDEVALATKFFDYAHARLPSSSATCGRWPRPCAPRASARSSSPRISGHLARALRAVLDDPERYRKAYDAPGLLEGWSWEAQAAVLNQVYDGLGISPAAARAASPSRVRGGRRAGGGAGRRRGTHRDGCGRAGRGRAAHHRVSEGRGRRRPLSTAPPAGGLGTGAGRAAWSAVLGPRALPEAPRLRLAKRAGDRLRDLGEPAAAAALLAAAARGAARRRGARRRRPPPTCSPCRSGRFPPTSPAPSGRCSRRPTRRSRRGAGPTRRMRRPGRRRSPSTGPALRRRPSPLAADPAAFLAPWRASVTGRRLGRRARRSGRPGAAAGCSS